MKTISIIYLLFILLSVQALAQQANIQKPNLVVTGNEPGKTHNVNNSISFQSTRFDPVVAEDLTYNFVPTTVFTSYDLQSNGTPQQIWQDPGDPDMIHMVFTASSEIGGWGDRNGKYLLSDDMGQNWQNLGNVQTGSSSCRGGFVTISGLNNGRPVVGLHTNDEIAETRTQIYVRDAGGSSWSRNDPGSFAEGLIIWPRVLGIGNEDVALLSSINGAPNDNFFYNTLDVPAGTFSGWIGISGDQAETHNLAKSADESIIGMAYVGGGTNELTFGDLFYRESLDGGITWSNEVLIYNYGDAGDSLGAMRGVDIVFLGQDPYVVFEVIKQDFSASTYFPSFPNKIMLWSPALNSGSPVVIADSNNIPYFENFNASNDVFGVLCRPSIGKSADNQALFITINATTENYLEVNTEANTYFAGYFMYSINGGITFSDPEKFTPETPLRDWRYISLNPINYVDPQSRVHVLMSAQADTIPGSTVNAPTGYPAAASAELVFISTEIQLNPGMPAVIVTAPNGGENWPAGITKSIHWLSFSVSNVKIEYTTNSGSSWITIENSIPSTGSYQWLVPGTVSSQCKVRITDLNNPGVTDMSNNNFSIVQAALTITSPNGGEVWIAGTEHPITWANQFVTSVKIEYSTNAGSSWITINNNTPGSGSYNWTVPAAPSAACLVKITSNELPSVFDVSNGPFSIVERSVIVTSPNGGEHWKTGSVHDITWNSSYVSNVRIQYSTNSGGNWLSVTNSTPSTGSYSWTVPNNPSENCRVRVFDPVNVNVTDMSDSNFAIVQSSITVTAPNGGEIWLTGSNQNITWISNDVSNVKLELSLNNGSTWTEIISSTQSTGIFNWTVPNIQSLQSLIAVSDASNPAIFDRSDNVFAIQSPSGIDDLLNEIPTEFSLHQNFPNPFNPATTIIYGVPAGCDVSLSIYNLLGEKITELVNGYKEPGYYKVNFNFEGYNSGIYLYKIKAGEFIQTKKMILIK